MDQDASSQQQQAGLPQAFYRAGDGFSRPRTPSFLSGLENALLSQQQKLSKRQGNDYTADFKYNSTLN